MVQFGRRRQAQKVERINAFIHNQGQGSLIIQEDDRWPFYLFGGFFTLVGGSGVFYSLILKLKISCIFDKVSGRMYLKRKNILKKEEVREEMLHEIKEAIVVELPYNSRGKIYNTKLILSSGEPITLPSAGVGSNQYEITQSINQFLGIKS